jgi:lipopolysaccharide export system permease protein
MLKILDKYLIKSFIGPFAVSFFIALFVLLMQQVWVYIDDIMGKGAGILFISEMIFYLSIYMMPMALVIGVLIASVMSVGALAERYELSSMKSAGVSVFRVIMPLVLACVGLAIFSYLCSDVFSTWAKLRYNARLYDIRRSKPALAIEEGVFSDNFAGYTIRIGKKETNDTGIKDIIIYQSKGSGSSEIIAKSGEMTATPDKQFMMMRLDDGQRYETLKDDPKKPFGFTRTNFKEWNKIFVLDELDRTEEGLFGNSPTTKSVAKLSNDIDSIEKRTQERRTEFSTGLNSFYSILARKDSSVTVKINQNPSPVQPKSAYDKRLAPTEPTPQKKGLNLNISSEELPQQINPQDFAKAGNFSNTFIGYKRPDFLSRTKQTVDNILSKTKHQHELHNKFIFAVLCIVFLFIGAPMGAIVRKGGFGYPVIIAISFFILFIFTYIMFRKLGEQNSMPPVLSIWTPVIVMSLIGAFLTRKAMRDERVFKTEKFIPMINFFKKIGKLFKREKKTLTSI